MIRKRTEYEKYFNNYSRNRKQDIDFYFPTHKEARIGENILVGYVGLGNHKQLDGSIGFTGANFFPP